ncbi:MAG: hypothetical protein AAGE52_25310 [Myxococcota bacterium]
MLRWVVCLGFVAACADANPHARRAAAYDELIAIANECSSRFTFFRDSLDIACANRADEYQPRVREYWECEADRVEELLRCERREGCEGRLECTTMECPTPSAEQLMQWQCDVEVCVSARLDRPPPPNCSEYLRP